jgi:branched-subunit amino acid transport protein
MTWLMIILMTVVVFTSRYLFLEPKLPLKLNKNTQHFLSYSAPAVLTAIFAPIVFIRDGTFNIGLDNPYFVCAIIAAIMAYVTRNVLLTTVVSMGIFFVLH